ncbi:alpha/beta hydrolase family esterase [Pseudorhodoferax sp.]|uniref:extracellular catalytic domain type 1 short-chain-length polyhydroxyalkanoate depolymerase n=1 Tax=Pseudorhodoferax sp. TaxID=1993553 RepID=UPI0039E27771
MLRRKTLKNLTRLWSQSLAPLLPAKPRRAKASKPKAAPARAPARAAKAAAKKTTRTTGAAKTTPATGGRWVRGAAAGPAGMRHYRLFLPAGRAAGQRWPLMVMLHGCDQNIERFAASTRMHQLGARQGFAVLYVEQDRLANASGCWNWFATRDGRAQAEVGLIMQAVEQACRLYRADRTRVAIAGLSAGASMAALVVTRHPERFQALAMHSGVPPGSARSGLGALSAMHGRGRTAPLEADAAAMADHWPALLVLQGGSDRVVKDTNGRNAAALWAAAADAQPRPPRQVQRGTRYAMQVTDYQVRRRTVATLVEIAQLGHAWSGGPAKEAYSDPHGPDASRLIWAFARRQFDRPR